MSWAGLFGWIGCLGAWWMVVRKCNVQQVAIAAGHQASCTTHHPASRHSYPIDHLFHPDSLPVTFWRTQTIALLVEGPNRPHLR